MATATKTEAATPTKPTPLSWRAINELIRQGTEEVCAKLLDEEKAGAKRPLFMNRIYGRFARLREARERRELSKIGGDR